MKNTLSSEAKQELSRLLSRILDSYTNIALQLNAFDIAAQKYATPQYLENKDFYLSTINNIPSRFLLPLEMDNVLTAKELTEKYRKTLLEAISKDYLIRIVADIDISLENIYESYLRIKAPTKDNCKIEKEVRNFWTNNIYRSFFIDELAIAIPSGKKSTWDMIFDRYDELRIIRHAIIHNSAILTQKHKNKLIDIELRLPEGNTMTLLKRYDLIKDEKVTFYSVEQILDLRKYFYEFVYFIQQAFIEYK